MTVSKNRPRLSLAGKYSRNVSASHGDLYPVTHTGIKGMKAIYRVIAWGLCHLLDPCGVTGQIFNHTGRGAQDV